MRPSKSEPKLKYSLSKFDDFFDRKNWQDPMFMDANNSQKIADEAILRSYSSVTIQTRAKLALNINEKVDKVLADSRKMGMIQKIENKSTKKSLAKISHVSTLPPIKTEVQETADRLKKIKNELNEYSEKFIKLEKEVSTTQAWINQTKEKSKRIMQILGQTGEKEQNKISERKEITESMKHDLQVKKYMRNNLRNDLVVIGRSKKLLDQRLKNLKIDLGLLNIQLENYNANLDKNLSTKVQYQEKQLLISEGIMQKSDIAQQKLTHQRNAERIKQKYQQVQNYDQLAFRHQTNLRQHLKGLTELRIQQALSRMISVLHHKYQTHWQQEEKCEALFKMYSSLNDSIRNSKGKALIQEKTKSSSVILRNSSVISVISGGCQKQQQEELSLVQLYENSKKTKNLLQQKIKEKQARIADLESIKKGLYKKWIEKTFEDSLTGGVKPQKKKTNFQKQIKALYERQKKAQRNKFAESEIEQWLARQTLKLNLNFSKKLKKDQKIIHIIELIKKESKNISKVMNQKQKKAAETKGKQTK